MPQYETPTCHGCQRYQEIARALRQHITEQDGEIKLTIAANDEIGSQLEDHIASVACLEVFNQKLTDRVAEITTAFAGACLERDGKAEACKKKGAIIWVSLFSTIFCLLLCITVLVG